MDAGAVSPVVAVEDSFVVFQVKDVRYPDKPQVRQIVEDEVWGVQRSTATSEYIDSLITRLTKVDEELLEKIDYEAEEPGFDRLLEDPRILVEIQGDSPVTVGELTAGVQQKFFHGIENAAFQFFLFLLDPLPRSRIVCITTHRTVLIYRTMFETSTKK